MAVLLQLPEEHWVCPNCTVTAVSHGQGNRYHTCAGLNGLSAPMVLDGMDCKVVAKEREDYVAGNIVQYDGEGRPIMAITTERPDGSNDLAVLLPTAQMKAE